ncbi:MAG: replication initiation factor domain-containing protein [[Eubacterium] siraeum]|nr:replication initiation factor domain-containing protein [[Eubacterium] siraeum]
MDFKFDYFRFSIIPQFKVRNRLNFVDFIITVVLRMPDKLFDFQTTKNGGFYDLKFWYHNIYIKVPPEDNPKEGYQVEMTGEGYDFYIEYRKNKDPNFDVRSFYADILSLREDDRFKVNITRSDVAVDDKSYTNKHYLDFNTLRNCVLAGEVLTRFRHRTVVSDGTIVTAPDKSTDYVIYEKGSSRNKLKGSTLYLGSRDRTHVRFYDKLAEMSAHGKEYDHNLKHWIRFELQACHDNALALITRFVMLEPEEFNKYLAKVLLNMVRFVDTSRENVASNYYRCPVYSWWLKFLGCVEKAKLVHIKPKVNKFRKSATWIKNSVAATAGGIIRAAGTQYFMGLIKEGIEEHYNERHDLIVDDYIHYKDFDADPLLGVDAYKVYFATDEEYRKFLIELRKRREETLLIEMDLQREKQKHNPLADTDE